MCGWEGRDVVRAEHVHKFIYLSFIVHVYVFMCV